VGPNPGDPIDLEPGVEIVAGDDGFKVRLAKVEDSRCPSDVVCVWAGNAKSSFVASLSSGATANFVLNTGLDPRYADVLGRRVTLIEVHPGAGPANTPIPQSAYRATIRVTPIPQP
jgi:hypothetical protein